MKWMNPIPLWAMCHLVLLAACAGAGKSAPAKADDGFARIAILNFANRTGSADFQYLSESLGDATREAMHRKFEFHAVQAAPGGPPEKTEADLLDELGKAGADVAILGSFEKSAPVPQKGKTTKADGIVVSGKIYAVKQRKVIAEYSRSTVVDARIFTAISAIAEEAVSSIQAYLRKVNENEVQVTSASGKQALTLRRLKLRIFVPPMF